MRCTSFYPVVSLQKVSVGKYHLLGVYSNDLLPLNSPVDLWTACRKLRAPIIFRAQVISPRLVVSRDPGRIICLGDKNILLETPSAGAHIHEVLITKWTMRILLGREALFHLVI